VESIKTNVQESFYSKMTTKGRLLGRAAGNASVVGEGWKVVFASRKNRARLDTDRRVIAKGGGGPRHKEEWHSMRKFLKTKS